MAASPFVPTKTKASLSSLTPEVHWAQKHTRHPEQIWSRCIRDYQLLYILEGEVDIEQGNECLRIQAGQMIYLASGIWHTIRILTPKLEYLGVHFDYFNDLVREANSPLFVKDEPLPASAFCAEPIIDEFPGETTLALFPCLLLPPPHTLAVMELIITEFNQRLPGFEAVCRGLMLQLLPLLLRNKNKLTLIEHNKYTASFEALTRQISEQYDQEWNNRRIADIVNLQEDYTARLFKAFTGMSPKKYIQYIRYQRSKELLRETDLKIETIGRKVGYQDHHYFSRLFKKLEGMPPDVYRKLSKF